MKSRFAIVLLISILLLVPLIVLGLNNRENIMLYLKLFQGKLRTSSSIQYSAQSTLPSVSVKLVDTQYLDFVAANLKLLGDQTVVDPAIYHNKSDSKQKYSISNIKFVLVPKIDKFLVAVSGMKNFSARGDYKIDGKTLVVNISLDLNEEGNPLAGVHQREDVFLRAALLTLYYAHGLQDGGTNAMTFQKIQDEVKSYVYNGVFAWPFQIKEL